MPNLSGISFLLKQHVHITPCLPGERSPRGMKGWKERATSSTERVKEMLKDGYKEHNWVVVPVPGFEALIDIDDVATAAAMGFPFDACESTFVVDTPTPNHCQIYFWQSEASIPLGNCDIYPPAGDDDEKQAPVVELKQKYKTVAAPMMERTDKEPHGTYKPRNGNEIQPMPKAVSDWFETHRRKRSKETSGEGSCTLDMLEDMLQVCDVNYNENGDELRVICPWCERADAGARVSIHNGFPTYHCFRVDCADKSFADYREEVDPDGLYSFPVGGDGFEVEDIDDELEEPETVAAFLSDPPKTTEASVKEMCYRSNCICGLEHPEHVPEAVPEETPEPEGDTSKDFVVSHSVDKRGIVADVIGVRMSDVIERPIEWLWKNRLPVGCGIVLSGKPGCGKSFATISLIASVTTGSDWPDGEKNLMGPRDVLLCATEDDPETTIKPRLMAAGADSSKVIFFKSISTTKDGKKKNRNLCLQEDIMRLHKTLVDNPTILLVVLDPLTGFYGDADGNDNKAIRKIMQGIAKVCQKTRVAFACIVHENKKSDAAAVDMILGAGAVSQVVRAGLRFSFDPKNKPDGRIMASIKGNLAKSVGGLRYSIESQDIMSSSGVLLEKIGYVVWGEKHDLSADDVIAEAKAVAKEEGVVGVEIDSKLGKAMEIFALELKNGKRLQREVHRVLEAADISEATRRRARKKLGVDSSTSAPWYWWLPDNYGTETPEERQQNTKARAARDRALNVPIDGEEPM